MSGALEERVTELEIRLAFVDDAVRALADADVERSQRVIALERALRDARHELAALRLAQADDPHREPPPPHY